MSTSPTNLVEVNTILMVPESVQPEIRDSTTSRLANNLGSLYVDGNAACNSYDVGLDISGTDILGVPDVSRPSSPHERNDLRKQKAVGLTR